MTVTARTEVEVVLRPYLVEDRDGGVIETEEDPEPD